MSLAAPTRTPAGDRVDVAGDQLAVVGERLREERDWAIRGAHRHGMPVAALARMMKMSVHGVSQIVSADCCL